MMNAEFRSRGVLAALAAALIFSCVGSAPAPVSSSEFAPATVTAINAAITKWFATYKAPGVVVGIWIPQRGTYEAAQGTSNVATGDPMTIADHFRIGSVTKSFTITVLLQLVADKQLGLDDPVSEYLSFVPNGDHITLRMLANMTAGLFNYTHSAAFNKAFSADPKRAFTPRELVDYGIAEKPDFAPGTGWNYSNTNTVLLGMIIQQKTNQRIGDVFQQYSFAPLGLSNTSWPESAALPEPYAHGVTADSPGAVAVDTTDWSPSEASTAGQLISTVDDLRIWAKACATGAQIPAALQKERLTWVTFPPLTSEVSYGLGIHKNHGWLGHNGSIPGYTTTSYYLPSLDATMVVLVNSDVVTNKVDPANALFRALAAIVTPGNVPT